MRAERKGAVTIARVRKQHRDSGIRMNSVSDICAIHKGERLTQRKGTADRPAGAVFKGQCVAFTAQKS